jgi:hypothetical protein
MRNLVALLLLVCPLANANPVVCTQCGSDGFHRYGPIGVTFGGYGLECSNCTHIEYFSKRPKAVEEGT